MGLGPTHTAYTYHGASAAICCRCPYSIRGSMYVLPQTVKLGEVGEGFFRQGSQNVDFNL